MDFGSGGLCDEACAGREDGLDTDRRRGHDGHPVDGRCDGLTTEVGDAHRELGLGATAFGDHSLHGLGLIKVVAETPCKEATVEGGHSLPIRRAIKTPPTTPSTSTGRRLDSHGSLPVLDTQDLRATSEKRHK